jgi:acetoin utilization protein AcuB
MTPNPVAVDSDTPVTEAAKLMREGRFRRLPVLDGGVLVGIVSDRDLKEASPSPATTLSVFEIAPLLDKLTVGRLMTSPVYTVSPDDPIEVAALLMEEHKLTGLPVIDGDALVGMLSVGDLLVAFVDLLELRQGGRLQPAAPPV